MEGESEDLASKAFKAKIKCEGCGKEFEATYYEDEDVHDAEYENSCLKCGYVLCRACQDSHDRGYCPGDRDTSFPFGDEMEDFDDWDDLFPSEDPSGMP